MKALIERIYKNFCNNRDYTREQFERDYGRPEPFAFLDQMIPEFKAILDIFAIGELKSALEIGQWEGAGLYYMLKHSPPDAKIYGLDEVQSRLKDWTKWDVDTSKLTLIEGDSTQPSVVQKVTNIVGELDYLFIDGCHYFDAVMQDYYNYGKLVKQGGIIMIHDINSCACNMVHVSRAWQLIKNKHSFTREFILNPLPDFMPKEESDKYSMGHYGIGLIYKE